MGRVTKPVAQSAPAVEARARVMRMIRLGIESVWKLSIKGSPAGVDKCAGSPSPVHGGYTQIGLHDLGKVSPCLGFPLSTMRGLRGKREKSCRSCL